jgi:hypothetical protein
MVIKFSTVITKAYLWNKTSFFATKKENKQECANASSR